MCKIWALLLVLLRHQYRRALFGLPLLTLITAFGIAVVKASLVATYFMHLNVEKRYIRYMLYSMMLMVGLFFAGTAPDVMKASGLQWKNQAVHELIEEHSSHEDNHAHTP